MEAQTDGVITIRYGTRRHGAGWLPAVVVNGRERIDWGRGHDKATALSLAHAQAREEAARYVGDWDISVTMEEP
jgi:hypothetical protein